MKVFIENESGTDDKNIYNEKTLEFKETLKVARNYPYPYGFILDTTGEDGDNIDVFVITEKKLKTGQIIECEPIGLMEQFEKSWDQSKKDIEEVDHNVLAILNDEIKIELSDQIKMKLTEFVSHVFDNIQENKTRVGNFLNKKKSIEYINKYKD